MNRRQIFESDEIKYKETVDKYGLNFMATYINWAVKEGEKMTKGQGNKHILKLHAMYKAIERIGIDEEMVKGHNYKYKVFDSKKSGNPFLASKETLRKQYIECWKDSKAEILAKKIQLENRLAKVCRYGREKVIESSMGRSSRDYFNIGLTRDDQVEEIGKIYTNNIQKKLMDKNMLESFLKTCANQYGRFGGKPSKVLSEEEFNKVPSVKECRGLVLQYKRKYDIDVKKVYEFITFEQNQKRLMREKDADIIELVNLYAKEKAMGIPSFEISIKNDREQIKKYENVLSINIPNYVCAFEVHAKTEILRDLQRQNFFRINKQTRENGLTPSIPHKITDIDILKTQELMKDEDVNFYRIGDKPSIKRAKVTNYLIDKAYQKQEYQKQEIKKNITAIKEKEAELKKEKEQLNNQKQKTNELSKEVRELKEKQNKNLGVELGGRE